jgi:hypothetical protein
MKILSATAPNKPSIQIKVRNGKMGGGFSYWGSVEKSWLEFYERVTNAARPDNLEATKKTLEDAGYTVNIEERPDDIDLS